MDAHLAASAIGTRPWAGALVGIGAARLPGAIKERLAVAIAKLIDRRAFTGIRATPADMGGGVTHEA